MAACYISRNEWGSHNAVYLFLVSNVKRIHGECGNIDINSYELIDTHMQHC